MSEPDLMVEDEWQALQEEANEVAMVASELEPGLEYWGFESYGDAPAAIGGGVGGFLWFADREQLFDFVARLLTFFSPGPSTMDHGAVARSAAEIVEMIRLGHVSMDEGMAKLNAALTRFSQIRWWGQLQDLVAGSRPFELEIRAWFRGAYSDDEIPDNSHPITDAELPEFINELREFGV